MIYMRARRCSRSTTRACASCTGGRWRASTPRRTQVLEEHDACVRELHRRAVAHVNARAQARAFAAVEPLLTEEEADVARRGRNAHSRPPKNQDPGDYARATALEALCGYLYLMGRNERLDELMRVIRQEEEDHA